MSGDHAALVARFEKVAQDPRAVQEQTLQTILAAGQDSPFGKAHGFSQIKTADQLRERLPISNYEGFRPWLEKDLASLTSQKPLGILKTSASTGKPKLVPYTLNFRRAIKAGHDVFSAALFKDYPDLPLKPGQPPMGIGLYQRTADEGTIAGYPYDTYISQLHNAAMEDDPFFHCFELPISQLVDASDRLYAMMLRAAGWRKLKAIRATNPTTLLLFGRLMAEQTDALLGDLAAGQPQSRPHLAPVLGPCLRPDPELARALGKQNRPLRPLDVWPDLELVVMWRGGACDRFRPFIEEFYGKGAVRSLIFASSEGVIALPMDLVRRDGPLAIESSFFEFRPADSDGNQTLLAHELEVGGRYELIFSSPSGLYRYAIGDLVDVEGKVGQTPSVTFVARKGRTSSLTGEKLTELQVETTMEVVEHRLGVRPRFFLLSAKFGAVPSYVLSVEWATPPPLELARRCQEEFEQELQRQNVEYRAKRESYRMDPIALQEVAEGEFERLFSEGMSARANVFKLPHLTSDPMHQKLKGLGRS